MLQEVSDKGISCLFIDIYRVFRLIGALAERFQKLIG